MSDPTDSDPDADAADVVALRAMVEKADALVAHYHQAITLAQSLKRSLVLRLLHKQHPRLSVSEQTKLMRTYGVEP